MRGNIAQLMQQAQRMQDNLQRAQEDIAKIETALLASKDIGRIIHMKTLYVGPDEIMVGAKVDIGDGLVVLREGALLADRRDDTSARLAQRVFRAHGVEQDGRVEDDHPRRPRRSSSSRTRSDTDGASIGGAARIADAACARSAAVDG